MMKSLLSGVALSAFLLSLDTLPARAFMSNNLADIGYEKNFIVGNPNVVKLSSLGVKCDGGLPGGDFDNTAILNSLTSDKFYIADCVEGGYIRIDGTWLIQDNLKMKFDDNTWLKSSITTLGVYPLSSTGGLLATQANTGVEIYGLNFAFLTRVGGVRMLLGWFNHFKFEHFRLDNTGGFAFLRCSDCEVAYGKMTNTYAAAGSPGLRHIGNYDALHSKVATGQGMKANAYFHHLNFQTGDGAFQTCQPGAVITGTGEATANWLYNVSSDDVLYENVYGESNSAVMLISEPGDLGVVAGFRKNTGFTWTCTHITYRHVVGKGFWFIASGSENLLSDVLVDDATFTYADTIDPVTGATVTTSKPSIGIGTVGYGPFHLATANTHRFTLKNISVANSFSQVVALQGPGVSDVTFDGFSLGAPNVGSASLAASFAVDGATNTIIKNGTIAQGNNAFGFIDGATHQSVGTQLENVSVTGVPDGETGFAFVYSDLAKMTGGSVTPAARATSAVGISLSNDATQGTTNSDISGVTVSAMPSGFRVICAPGKHNQVYGLFGEPDCAP